MDKTYGFILKFLDCADNEIEIYSDEEIEGKVIWPSYSQAEPIRLRGIFSNREEAQKAAEQLPVYRAMITYDHGDFVEEEDSVDGFGEGGLDFPAYFFSSDDAKTWVNCRIRNLDEDCHTSYEITKIEIADIEVFEIT